MKPGRYLVPKQVLGECLQLHGGQRRDEREGDGEGKSWDRPSDSAARPSNLLLPSQHSPSTPWGEASPKGLGGWRRPVFKSDEREFESAVLLLLVPPLPHCSPQEQPKF